jgi:hypothetical protein
MSSLPYHSCIGKGHLKDLKDRSKEMEAKRGGFRKRHESKNMMQGVEEAFLLDADLE